MECVICSVCVCVCAIDADDAVRIVVCLYGRGGMDGFVDRLFWGWISCRCGVV